MSDNAPIITLPSVPEGSQFESEPVAPIFGKDLVWRVVYLNEYGQPTGEELLSEYPDGTKGKYKDIKRGYPFRFDLMERSGNVVCSVFIRDTQRLIYRRRTLIPMGKPYRPVIYLVGWQDTIITPAGPRNKTALMYVYPDGSIALDGTRSNLELYPEEM